MTQTEKRFENMYKDMTVKEKFKAVRRLWVYGAARNVDMTAEMTRIGKTLTYAQARDWLGLLSEDEMNRAEYYKKKYTAAELEIKLYRFEENREIAFRPRPGIPVELWKKAWKIHEDIVEWYAPYLLKNEDRWRPEYAEMGVFAYMEDAIQRLKKEADDGPYNSELTAMIKEVIEDEEKIIEKEPLQSSESPTN